MDRELSGYGIGDEQFRKYVPRDFRTVAVPPDAPPVYGDSDKGN